MRAPRHVWAIATLVPAATLLLYVAGARLTPPGKSFLWMHALNTGDTYAYLAWAEQARDGHALFRVPFTEEPCRRLLFHPLFLAIGAAARALALPSIALYHAARVALGALLLLALHRFFARRLRAGGAPPGAATFALLYAALGSGLGWLFARPDLPALRLPVDLWMPEAVLFLTILESPLFIGGLLLGVLVLEGLLPADGEPRFAGARGGALLVLLVVLLGFTHPFELVTIAATLAVAAALGSALRVPLPRGFARSAALFAVGVAIAFAYVRFVLGGDPVFARWLAVVRSPSPPPAAYLAAFAPQIALALFALPRVLARRAPSDLLLLAWPVAAALLLYSPLAQQRRFVAGAQIPLTALAVEGLLVGLPDALRRGRAVVSRWRGRALVSRRDALPREALAAPGPGALPSEPVAAPTGRPARVALLAAFLALSFATNAVVLRADVAHFRLGEYPLYLERDLLAAIAAFRDRSGDDALLLASPEVAHFVPALAGRRVFGGHADMTVDAARKADEARRFFGSASAPGGRRALLARAGVTHVLLSPYEAAFAGRDPAPLAGPDPAGYFGGDAARLGLVVVFRAGPVTLFEVTRG